AAGTVALEATVSDGPGAGAGVRCHAEKVMATLSTAAEAKPRRAVEPQNAVNQRRTGDGSKILSLTKPMRCGISSSRSENRAASVARSRSISSWHAAQVLTWAST